MVPRATVAVASPLRTVVLYGLAALLGAFAATVTLVPSSSAETMREAMAAAYANNPTLEAERARLRAIDEEVARARSNYRPSLSADADTGYEKVNVDPRTSGIGGDSGGTTHPKGYSFTLTQSLFRGLRTVNGVREAKASVRAGRESLRAVEQSVLQDAVIAYMDVVRDQAIVRLRQGNVRVLSEQLKATEDRFEVGEVTKTDVAQAEARRSGSISQLELAQSNLKTSRATYERVIGHPPSNLIQPSPIDALLPDRLREALNIASDENPNILSAVYAEEAARYVVKQVIGEMLPEVSVQARYSERWEPSTDIDVTETTSVVGFVTVPLYSGGEPSARARQARETQFQRRREIDQARDQARSDVVAAWGRLQAANAQIESDQEQVRASGIALEGVREEEKVGQRTILDVLDAEQEHLNAQVTLVTTKRDMVVAAFSLLASVGRLDAAYMRLPVDYYDPSVHYEAVDGKWFGLDPYGPGHHYRPPEERDYPPRRTEAQPSFK